MLHLDDPKMNRIINYIQAFEIKITNWEGKFKLSQDKNPTDYENARQELIQKSAQSATDFLSKIYRAI